MIIKASQPDSNDARLAFQASEDTLRAALHGVDPDGVTAAINERRASGSSSTGSHHNNSAPVDADGKYPVAWQLSAVREELAETRNIASRLRRQIGARDGDCALLEARIVDAGKRRKEIEEEITDQLKRRSKISHLAHTTERQKAKIGIHPTSSGTTSLGRPLGVERKSSSSCSPSRGTRSSSSSARRENEFDYQTANRDDEIRFELAEQEHDREMAEIRHRHRMFREEIIKWQKKRRILENSSLKMSVQAEHEKFFDADNIKQRKAERRLLQSAEGIRDIRKGERDHLESQNREIGKHLGELKMRVRDAEEELAAKRRTMEGLRREATRIQKAVVQARQDTAQSVIAAQEALERVRFEENKALREAQQRQREAADRARLGGMNAFGGGVGVGEEASSSSASLPPPPPSFSSRYKETAPPDNNDGDDDHEDENTQKTKQEPDACEAREEEEDEVKFSIVETKNPPVVPVSPPRKLPQQQQQQQTSSPNNYQQFLHQFHSQQQQKQPAAATAAAVLSSSSSVPVRGSTTSPNAPPLHQRNNNNLTDRSHEYRVYNSEQDDPRDAWFTLAPRDGATSDELYNELTRIVRTVAVEFGRPQLELLDGIQQ